MMRSQSFLTMLLLSAAGLATPSKQEATSNVQSEKDVGEAIKSATTLLMDPLGGPLSSILARESSIVQAIKTQLPFSQTSLYGETFSFRRTVVETAVRSPTTYHSAEHSKPTPKPTKSSPSNHRIAETLTPTIKTISTIVGGGLLNSTASETTNNSTISASVEMPTTSLIETIPIAVSNEQNATAASSTPIPSSTPNMGVVQPTGTLKAAGALAIGVAGIMILL